MSVMKSVLKFIKLYYKMFLQVVLFLTAFTYFSMVVNHAGLLYKYGYDLSMQSYSETKICLPMLSVFGEDNARMVAEAGIDKELSKMQHIQYNDKRDKTFYQKYMVFWMTLGAERGMANFYYNCYGVK